MKYIYYLQAFFTSFIFLIACSTSARVTIHLKGADMNSRKNKKIDIEK